MVEARRQKRRPRGLRTRQRAWSIALKCSSVAGEVEDGVAEDYVEGIVGVAVFYGLEMEVVERRDWEQ